MDPRLTGGFLGTGATLASDVSLLLYIVLLVPLMLIGWTFARRHLFVPHHKYVMTSITLINWIIIAYLMATTYFKTDGYGVAPYIPARLNEPPYLLPTLHLITGGAAQLIATILVIRMWFEKSLPAALRFEPIKPWMRLTLALWLVTAALGVGIYFYSLPRLRPLTTESNSTPTTNGNPNATPNATPDVTPNVTPQGTPDTTPESTPESTPDSTPES